MITCEQTIRATLGEMFLRGLISLEETSNLSSSINTSPNSVMDIFNRNLSVKAKKYLSKLWIENAKKNIS